MITLWLIVLAVLLADQTLKFLLRRHRGLALGRFGSVQMVEGKLWLRRFGPHSSGVTIWIFWVAAAVALVIVSTFAPSVWPFVGLLLGGSLSNILESSLRGTVTDYICLRFWPTFNLADLALTAGAIGTLTEFLIVGREMVS